MSGDDNGLRGSVAIIGVGESDIGRLAEATGASLRVQAAIRAVEDAGIDLSEIDAVFTTGGHGFQATDMAEKLGLRPAYVDSTLLGGASFVSYLLRAAMAVQAGLCTTALIVYGESSWANLQRCGGLYGGQHALVPERVEFEDVYGNFLISAYAMAAQRYMHQYGARPEHLAQVAVLAREHARLNPKALMRDPLTVDEVLASRLVAEPLHLLDCCPVTDGGGAVIVTAVARARDARRSPVYVLGAGEAMTHNLISQMPDLTTTAAVESGRRAFALAGVGPEDVDVVGIYDAFSFLPLILLEDLGFCRKGQAPALLESGDLRLGGRLPMNTHGGALSYTQPGMHGVFLIVEAVRQLRGEAGPRQVTDARVALVHANGGVMSHQATAILGVER